MAEAVGYLLFEALRKPLGFFLFQLKALRKAVGNICSKALEVLEKAVGFFPYPLKALRKGIAKKVMCSINHWKCWKNLF